MFFGILLGCIIPPKEHNPPHIHASYQGVNASFAISDGRLMKGDFPARQSKFVEVWIDIHREDLLADWELCQNGEKPFPIEPLR